MIPSSEVKELSFRDYSQIVTKRWWIVLIAVVLAFVSYRATLSSAPDAYQATVRFAVPDSAKGRSTLLLLKSRSMAQTVASRLSQPLSADNLLGMVAVDGPSKEGLCVLSAFAYDPKLAATVANLWIDQFTENFRIQQKESLETEAEAAAADLERLEGPIKEASQELIEGEMALSGFEETRQVDAERERQVQLLAEKIKTMEKGRQDLSSRYTEDHPRMVYMKNEIESIKAEIAAKKKEMKGLSKEDTEKYLLLKQRQEALKKNYDSIVQKSQALAERVAQIKLEQETAPSGKGLEGVLQVIDRAIPPTRPVPKPDKAAQFIFIGLLVGAAVCFLLEYLDTTLKIPEEVELYAGMPFLGFVPVVHGIAGKKNSSNIFSHLRPDSYVAEAFRNVKVSLIFASDGQKPMKTILVTSADPHEGKTLVASNLAIIFAMGGEKTLLIDGDIRRGVLAASYSLEKGSGFSDLIKGVSGVEEAVKATDVPGLSLLSPGSLVPNATDLWTSPGFHRTMEELKGKFDRIVIDGTSLLGPPDTLLMSKDLDGMLFVLASRKTKLGRIKEANKKMTHSAAPIIGAVLNKTAVKKDKNYYGTYFQNAPAAKVGWAQSFLKALRPQKSPAKIEDPRAKSQPVKTDGLSAQQGPAQVKAPFSWLKSVKLPFSSKKPKPK